MTSLDTCGFEKLITICHGDAKPNNFLFRNINIEFDDLDLGEDLDCEGLHSIYLFKKKKKELNNYLIIL